jgi:hypothetical protein
MFGVPILVALNAADTARGLEGMSDEAVVADAMEVGGCDYDCGGTAGCLGAVRLSPYSIANMKLQTAPTSEVLRQLGGAVPPPRQTFVTRWAADPFSRGSYSYYAVGNAKEIVGEWILEFADCLGWTSHHTARFHCEIYTVKFTPRLQNTRHPRRAVWSPAVCRRGHQPPPRHGARRLRIGTEGGGAPAGTEGLYCWRQW